MRGGAGSPKEDSNVHSKKNRSLINRIKAIPFAFSFHAGRPNSLANLITCSRCLLLSHAVLFFYIIHYFQRYFSTFTVSSFSYQTESVPYSPESHRFRVAPQPPLWQKIPRHSCLLPHCHDLAFTEFQSEEWAKSGYRKKIFSMPKGYGMKWNEWKLNIFPWLCPRDVSIVLGYDRMRITQNPTQSIPENHCTLCKWSHQSPLPRSTLNAKPLHLGQT